MFATVEPTEGAFTQLTSEGSMGPIVFSRFHTRLTELTATKS